MKHRIAALLAFASVLAVPTLTAQTAAPSRFLGTWEGALNVGAARLRLALVVERDSVAGMRGAMISVDQGNARIPGSVTITGDTLTIALSAAGARFQGVINTAGDSLKGTFSQGAALPLALHHVQGLSTRARPQDPKAPFPYHARDVTIESVPGVRLSGTVVTPEGAGPFPAVVFVTGSGPQNRDEELMEHRPFLVIADYLARRGIASLRYDDRGVGRSTGVFGTATTADFGNDAEAAFRALRAESGVDARHVGIIGHSEGGAIAPMIAARNKDVAFVVLLAGPGVPGDSILMLQTRALALASGAPLAAVDQSSRTNRTIYDIVKANSDTIAMMAALRKAAEQLALESKPGAALDTSMVGAIMQQIAPITTPWYRYFLSYDPRPALSHVTVPVLALNGTLDLQVPHRENLSAIKSALAAGGNKDVEIVEMPNLNHLFQTAKTGLVTEYAQIDESISPAVLERIASWINQHAARR